MSASSEHLPVAPKSLAAILRFDDDGEADTLLTAFAHELQRQGYRVGGLVQSFRARPDGGRNKFLLNLATGQEVSIFQDSGSQSLTCSVDPSLVAQASGVLRQALAEQVDLAVVNRFGALEAIGGGFGAEILALALAGIPVLTIVPEQYLQDWRLFSGDMGDELPAHPQFVRDWFAQVLAAAPDHPAEPGA